MRWNYYCVQQERERIMFEMELLLCAAGERQRIMFEMELLLCAAGEREDTV